MKRFKFRIVILLFIIITLGGILKINVEYNKNSKKQVEQINYNDDNVSGKEENKADLYSEINISRKEGKKLKIYFSREPFNLTFNIGNYVMYINMQVYYNIVEEKNKIISSARYIINNNLNILNNFKNGLFKGKK